ncbi:hypothetical protein [Actinokineospora spheciospongiae]|uniref:hypothetical protein n=1 Tax=Actinokineospora spheciospongiae TaxID=909613 RepID=UPI000D99F813|nr:hypothetical protein [Actinokineospora spheciospongiae]PWW53695.1 hypothetical protein DFQ13_11579 [Actinokineospora spheciospongiae]
MSEESGVVNRVSGAGGHVVQVGGGVSGGIHFHGPSTPPPELVPRPTPHFTNQRAVLRAADRAFAEAGAGRWVLVLTGPPGVGKREAARAWVHDRRRDFPDGTFHADLTGAGVGAEADLLGAFLLSAGFAAQQIPSSPEGRAGLFRSWSAGRRVAVVVERASTPAQVRSLAPAGDGSALVVTQAGPLHGLRADNVVTFLELAPLEASAARELFGRIAGPERAVDEPDAVAEVLEVADGLPIAVCVAASMVAAHPQRSMTRLVGALRDEQRRLRALSRDGGDLSVTAVFNTAYQRLTDDERACYRAAGAHPGPGGFGAHVIAAALGWDLDRVHDSLDSLVGAQLVTEFTESRHSMHSLVRAHARQVAAPEGEREALLRRVVAFYRDRAVAGGHRAMPGRGMWERLRPGQALPEVDVPWRWLEDERANLLAAVVAASDLGLHEVVCQMCLMLWPLHERGKHLDDLRRCGDLGVESARALGDVAAESLFTTQLGFGHVHRGEALAAAELFTRALALARTTPFTDLAATALESLGLAQIAAGADEAAARTLRHNLDLAGELGQPRRTALARLHLAKVDDLPSALALLDAAEAQFLGLEPPDTYNAGKAAQWRGRRLIADPARRAEARAELLRADRVLDQRFDRMTTREALGDLASAEGEHAEAAARYREALSIAETEVFPHDGARLARKLADLDPAHPPADPQAQQPG